MKSYNGFDSAQRNKAQRWLNTQWAAGKFARPSRCCACGQTEGVIDAHAEDYSEPFRHGKTDQYPLCFICHMMVHCRFANRAAWDVYRRMVADGWRAPAFKSRNFPGFQRDFLNVNQLYLRQHGWAQHRRPARRYLDGIAGKDR